MKLVFHYNLRFCALASLYRDGWLASDLPALLIAITLNWYSLPACNFCMVAEGVFVSTVSHNCHSSSPLAFASTWYPVMGAPPSSMGTFQAMLMCLSDQSVTSGALGGKGAATNDRKYENV